jgi:hypothetical protein
LCWWLAVTPGTAVDVAASRKRFDDFVAQYLAGTGLPREMLEFFGRHQH